jgi:hypothetical protein
MSQRPFYTPPNFPALVSFFMRQQARKNHHEKSIAKLGIFWRNVALQK